MPRARQDHHERPHRAPPPTGRVEPHPEPSVVDLRLLPGRWTVAQHGHLPAAGLLGQVGPHPPAQAGHARVQAVLVAQPLMDRRDRHPRRQLVGDVVAVGLDARPRHLPQPVIDQLWEPLGHQPPPVGLGHRRPARRHPGRDRRGGVLAQRLAIHAQAGRELVLRPARIPVGQDLDHVDHVEGPPRQRRAPSPRCWTTRGGASGRRRAQPGTNTHAVPMGNYVIAGWGITGSGALCVIDGGRGSVSWRGGLACGVGRSWRGRTFGASTS